MAGNQVNGQQVQVLSAEKLDGMDVNGVRVPSTGCLLAVMMLVYQRVNRSQVEELVEAEVEEIIKQVEGYQRPEGVAQVEVIEALIDGGSVIHNLSSVIHEKNRRHLIDGDKYHI